MSDPSNIAQTARVLHASAEAKQKERHNIDFCVKSLLAVSIGFAFAQFSCVEFDQKLMCFILEV